MRAKIAIALGVASCIAAPSPWGASAAELPGPYIPLGLGASFLEGLSVKGPLGNEIRLNENVGILGTAGLGYAFGNGFRAEAEFGYRANDAKNVTVPSGATTPTALNLKANAKALSYMANGIYDFNISPSWIPYVGAGVGAANVRVNNIGHDTPFAWQAMAGIEHPIRPDLLLGVGYKFLGTEDLRFRNTPFGTSSRANYYDHAAMLTLRWKFGVVPAAQPVAAAPPPPPPPPAAATAPPPPPPSPQTYTVYFGLNSAALDQPAQEVVREAARSALKGGLTHITVTGHTDTAGSAQHNQRLSERRAEAVRQALVADGVPADQIGTGGRGEAEPAVPTGQNVREPRNRRVVITEETSASY